MRSIVSTSATCSCRQRSASRPNGRLLRLTRKPAPSARVDDALAHRLAQLARAAPRASGEDCTAAMTSTSRITGGGLKKCMPDDALGSGAALAIAVIGIDEVFDASTASGAISPSSANSSLLELEPLGHRLDDHVAAGEVGRARGARQRRARTLAPFFSQRAGDLRDRGVDVGDRVVQQRLASPACAPSCAMPGAHRPGARRRRAVRRAR